MKDVGQHQFLMLLLVVEADFQKRKHGCERRLIGGVEQVDHRGIDVASISLDLLGSRTRQQATLMTGMARARADVRGVE